MADRHTHTLARKLVQDALDRFADPDRAEVHEGDAQLIVMGAILEEVSNGGSQRNGGITMTIGRKTLAAIIGVPASGGGLWAVLKGFGVG